MLVHVITRVSEIALSCTTSALENVQKLVQLQNPEFRNVVVQLSATGNSTTQVLESNW